LSKNNVMITSIKKTTACFQIKQPGSLP